jgi:hypothetical protein
VKFLPIVDADHRGLTQVWPSPQLDSHIKYYSQASGSLNVPASIPSTCQANASNDGRLREQLAIWSPRSGPVDPPQELLYCASSRPSRTLSSGVATVWDDVGIRARVGVFLNAPRLA